MHHLCPRIALVLLILLAVDVYAQGMSGNTIRRRAGRINQGEAEAGPDSVADAVPTAAETVSEDPHSDNTWVDPENIYGVGEASITDNAFDNGDQSYILKAYTFDFSSVPEGATIVGAKCVINARSSSSTHQFDLIQILDTSRAKVGTNMAATPVTIASAVGADYSVGANDDTWGNSLTDTWVKDANFGVAIGVLSNTNNSDVYIDYVLLTIYYTTE